MRLGRLSPALRALVSGTLVAYVASAIPSGADETPLGGITAVTQVSASASDLPRLPGDPSIRDGAFARLAALSFTASNSDLTGPGVSPAYGPLGLPCDAELSARPGPGGTVLLRLEAPCQSASPVILEHGDLAATYRASSSGVVETYFPAFTDIAEYTARLPGGQVLTVSAQVPGAGGYERMVTMWDGTAGLSVHAFEYGAGPGSVGHIWREAPRAATLAEAGRGGYLLRLGDVPGARRAEVYSFPAAEAARAGSVRIVLAAAITPETCGRALEAVTLQLGQDLPGAPVAVTLAMPDCGAAPANLIQGDLMLKNLARDLKIAAH